MRDELVQNMHMMGASPSETELINDGFDFCATGPCIRWRCRGCDYVLYGTEEKPPINYCPMFGRRIKDG